MASVAIRRFGGMRSDANPHDVAPGYSLVQVNVDCASPGEFRVRPGTRLVRFADPPRPSAPSWSQSRSDAIGLSASVSSVLLTTGFSRGRNDSFAVSTSAASEVDRAQWAKSRSDSVGFSESIQASTQSASVEVSADVASTISIAAPSAASKTSASYESFTLLGMM